MEGSELQPRRLFVARTLGDRSARRLADAGRALGIAVQELSYGRIARNGLPDGYCDPGLRAILRDPFRKGARHEDVLRTLLDASASDACFLDEQTLRDYPNYEDKGVQASILAGRVPLLESSAAEKDYTGPFPVVLKRRLASAGRGTFLIRSPRELSARLGEEGDASCILQRYVELEADYRVLVLDGEVLGAAQRELRIHEEPESARLAVKVFESVRLPQVMLDDAVRAAKALRCDFAGVDIVVAAGEHFVLECNVSPQFVSTERVLSIPIAERVLRFLFDK